MAPVEHGGDVSGDGGGGGGGATGREPPPVAAAAAAEVGTAAAPAAICATLSEETAKAMKEAMKLAGTKFNPLDTKFSFSIV